MASSTNDLLGAASPLLLPSSAPNPTTAATDLAAVVVPLRCDSDRGIDPAAGALCQVRSNERDGLAAAGETSGGGFFPALVAALVLCLAAVGLCQVVVGFARRLLGRTKPSPSLPAEWSKEQGPDLRLAFPQIRTIELMGSAVLSGRSPGTAIVLEKTTEDGVASIAIAVFTREVFERAIVPAMAQFGGGKVS